MTDKPQTIADQLRDPAQAPYVAEHAADVMEKFARFAELLLGTGKPRRGVLGETINEATAALRAFNGEQGNG